MADPAVVIDLMQVLKASLAYELARKAWEADLAHNLGPNYANAAKTLAARPRLRDRATRAEQRQPGSGQLVALAALKRQQDQAP